VLRRALFAACVAVMCVAPVAVDAADPPVTRFEATDGAAWTTHQQELAFLAAVDALSARMSMEVIGRTEKGRPLHLVRLGSPAPATAAQARTRPTQLHVCSQHGNEPAGREACLIRLRDLAFGADDALLSSTVVLFVPAANPDGRAANTRENSRGVDINRDHLNLTTSEARAVAAVVRDWQPDLAIDHHEYGPSTPVVYDDELLYLWPRNLNVDSAVHDLALSFSKEALAPCAADAGFTSDEYGLLAAGQVDVTQTAGDGDEGIMRNLMGLRHSLGILIESAIDQDVTNGLDELTTQAAVNRRRVASQATVIDCAAAFMRARGQEVAATTAGSVTRKIAEGRDRSAPVYFQGQDEDTTVAQDAPPPVSVNPPPCGYDLTAAHLEKLGAVLDLHGVTSAPRPGGARVLLAQAAEPVIALLLDARNEDRHAVAGTPLDVCLESAAAPRVISGSAPENNLPATGGDNTIALVGLGLLAALGGVRLIRRLV
jgi:LPXTG-motif cell wall-anchored protein